MLLLLSFGLYLCGISFSSPSLSVCMCPLFWGESFVDNIYRGLSFCIHSASLCLLVGAFNPFMFKVIIDKYDPVAEKVMAPHSSSLTWKIPWMEKPGGLQSMGSLRVGYDWATSLSLFTFMHWRRKWQPTPVFLPGESQGMGEPGELLSTGSHRVGHDWSNLAAAAAVNEN